MHIPLKVPYGRTISRKVNFIFKIARFYRIFVIEDGFYGAYRPPQTLDLMNALEKNLDNDIPTFFIAGNHDLTERTTRRHVRPYELVWGEPFYRFKFGQHKFLAVETQYFRIENPESFGIRKH